MPLNKRTIAFMDINGIRTVSALNSSQALRQQAETVVSDKVILSTKSLAALSPEVVLKMMHELQVHQVELEMQNEELRQSQLALEVMRQRYFDLYDLAPISYCTVSEAGFILEANLAAAELLGEVRCKLVGQRISRYIDKTHQDTYYLSRKRLYAHGERQECELHLIKPDGVAVWAQVHITAAKDSNGDMVQRMVLSDITNAKVMAQAMQASEQKLRGLVSSLP